MTVYECSCGERFDFIMSTQYRRDPWGGIYAVYLHDNFHEWRAWLGEHKPHGEVTAVDYGEGME